MRKNSFIACCVLFFVFNATMSSAGSFRCGQKLVSTGNSKAEIFRKCGEPSWREYSESELWPENSPFAVAKITREQWVYNRGSQALIRYLNFENGNLVSIDLGDYGFNADYPKKPCRPEELELRHSKSEIMFKCGTPYFKDTREEYRVDNVKGSKQRTTITVDEWTYNFGPTRFLRILTFENGKLVKIRQGERGG
ncbi:MAG: DUF2845 domain-containing protein [Gammaproteobacteria bacterium]|nr:DUF2845 domain-containing protein [Gammaproteobacteria bacterium]